jgi:hypothetical protein
MKCWHGFPARKLALVVIVVLSALTLKELPLRVAQQQSVRSAQLKSAITAVKRLQKFFAHCASRKLEVDATNVVPALFSLVFKVRQQTSKPERRQTLKPKMQLMALKTLMVTLKGEKLYDRVEPMNAIHATAPPRYGRTA